MQKIIKKITCSISYIFLLFLLLFNSGCQKDLRNMTAEQRLSDGLSGPAGKVPQLLKDFTQVNLVGNNDEYDAARVDPLLLNAWGLTFSPTGIAWISAQAAGVSTVYSSEGLQILPAVSIPSPAGATGGNPTGVVFNGTTDFKLANGNPARFIFDGLDGIISGWNGGTAAAKVIDNSATSVYTGLAIAADGGNNFLYAANFKAGKIDVFDKDWVAVNTKPFMDPNLPAGYGPFNIQAVGGQLYVMYAKENPMEAGEEETGPGLGYVDIYNTDGSFVKRFVSKGQLNAPWGIAWAPPGFFGSDENAQAVILIGNFGDGHINAYSTEGSFLGQLRAHGNPIVIDRLWAISFPPSTSSISPNRLYFTAGPDDEQDGLFGYIIK
jgi:uncharacterized protein (TIGR03118 family)